MKRTPLWFLPLATVLLAGCPLPIFESDPPPDGGGGHGGDDDDDDDYSCPPQQPPTSPETIAAVATLFRENCSHCHGLGEERGNLPDIFDVDELKRRGLIGNTAEYSPLYQLVDAGLMPPQDALSPVTGVTPKRVTPEQKLALRAWIDSGAPSLRGDRNRIDLASFTRLLRRDLSALSRPEQTGAVYVSFHSVYNNRRYSDAELGAFANATLKLLNGLDPLSERTGGLGSGSAVIVSDQSIPLAVRFQPARFNLSRGDIDRILALSNRQDANAPFECDVPAIPVQDFLQIASADDFFNPITETFESTYSNVLVRRVLQRSGVISPTDDSTLVFDPITKAQFIANGFTNVSNFTVTDVLAARGADLGDIGRLFNEGNDNERLKRACLLNSGVSAANRCLDRFDLASPVGASAWVTWDATPLGTGPNDDFFRAFLNGPANPPANPIVQTEGAFVAAGGEAIFQLPNYMQGYAIFNANLNLVTNPPSLAVLNPAEDERGNFISARACSGCHANYTIPFKDAAFNVAFENVNSPDEGVGFLFKAVQPQENWDFQLADDSARYLEELQNVYIARSESGDLPDGIYNLGSHYLYDLAKEDIVAELGLLDVQELEDLVDNTTDLVADLRSVFGGGISRENFVLNYQTLVNLTRPETHDLLRACVAREVSVPGDFGTTQPVPATSTISAPLSCAR